MPHFASRGRRCVGKPHQRNTKQAEIGVDQRNSLVEANSSFGSIELPLGMFRIADRNPCSLNEIQISGKSFHGARLEIERIVRQQNLLVRLPHDFESAVNVLKQPMARADVVVRFRGFDMLAVVVQLNVPCGNGFLGFLVVFDMVRAKPRVRVANVNVAIGAGDVTLMALRAAGINLRDLALARRRRTNLLTGANDWRKAEGCAEKHRQSEETTERSVNLCPGMMTHAIHAIGYKTIA